MRKEQSNYATKIVEDESGLHLIVSDDDAGALKGHLAASHIRCVANYACTGHQNFDFGSDVTPDELATALHRFDELNGPSV